MRAEHLPAQAQPGLPAGQVDPFLRGREVMDTHDLAQAPRIVSGHRGQTIIAPGDQAYSLGPSGHPLTRASIADVTLLRVLRPAQALRDATTGQVLGYETRQIAQARLVDDERPAGPEPGAGAGASSAQRPAVIEVLSATEEVRPGDLLQPHTAAREGPASYPPHMPAVAIRGRVVAVDAQGALMAGPREVVIIDRGLRDGLAAGHLLSVRRARARTAIVPGAGAVPLSLPQDQVGTLMVVRIHQHLSQALILRAHDGIRPGDEIVGGP